MSVVILGSEDIMRAAENQVLMLPNVTLMAGPTGYMTNFNHQSQKDVSGDFFFEWIESRGSCD